MQAETTQLGIRTPEIPAVTGTTHRSGRQQYGMAKLCHDRSRKRSQSYAGRFVQPWF
jgi:hypothetical protein